MSFGHITKLLYHNRTWCVNYFLPNLRIFHYSTVQSDLYRFCKRMLGYSHGTGHSLRLI